MSTDFRIVRERARLDPTWDVIRLIWDELATPYEADPRLDELTTGQRAIYALSWIRAEVMNGGFDQCLWNSTGRLLPTAAAGAHDLGLHELAAVFEAVLDCFDAPYPVDRGERQLALDRIEPGTWRQFDERYDDECARWPDGWDEVAARYIDEHPDEFFVPARDEEHAARALIESVRDKLDSGYRLRDETVARLRGLLDEAVDRSATAGSGAAAAEARTILDDPPFTARRAPWLRRGPDASPPA